MPPLIEVITFDVTHTLIHCPRLGEIYSEVLGRHGIAVEPAAARRLVRTVWQEFACLADPGRDRFREHPEGARGWWQRFLVRFCQHLDAPPPSRFASAELFHRFGQPESWEVYPEVRETLGALKGQGLGLGVISNWDDRLPALLAGLDLVPFFDAVVYSSDVGAEKPGLRIFRQALARLGVAAESALHVGDSRLEDVEGAIAAGMRGLLLDRGGRSRRGGIRDLARLPRLVAAPAATAELVES
ncbi:MAG TPA: HAD-IA family hydrolase [Thermoanaerobaculia bacterium]|nr:HAD-IA family hydrolase [Thermoanaerobaculia bacterium]